jgi:GTPase SAR1 family protein
MSISIIHLTDIHMVAETEANTILSRKQQLYEACYSVLSPNDTAIIVISGDIAFSGKTKEYDNALDLICYIQQMLSKYLSCDIKVLMVPGNHDCNFEGEHSLRDRLLSTFDASLVVDSKTLKLITSVQQNFVDFAGLFSSYDPSTLCNKHELKCGTKKLLFQMINSAWMSQAQEQPGKIIIPQETFSTLNTDNYDCVFTVMHHPYNWLQPDNYHGFIDYIRQTTDVLLVGHDHRKDAFRSLGEKWSILELHGKELQNSSGTDSAFSIYQFDDAFQNYTTLNFSWKDTLYYRESEYCNMFIRNTMTSSLLLRPSKKYLNEYIDDPGMNIIHETLDNIRLPEIYCWPDLEKIEIQDSAPTIHNKRITENVPQQLLSSTISIIIGDSLSGKTSLAKMLFKNYSSQNDKCCILLEGDILNTTVDKNLRKRIEDKFIVEYSTDNLERYRQLPIEKRILIIDDFNNMPYHDERRAKVLLLLSQYAAHIIIITDNEIETTLISSKLKDSPGLTINHYKICYFGNAKRKELTTKWYCLRNEYANKDEEIDARIENSFRRINMLLGSIKGFIPATPIYLICLLQNIDAVVPASFAGSQYGYLYDSLINKSLSTIKYGDAGAINIDINVMSNLAFDMLRMKSNTFSKEELDQTTHKFEIKKKVIVDTRLLIENMIASRLIKEIGHNTYKFRYPYIFYYFSGRYIAYNLNDPVVKEQIDYMIQRLYNEKYGNIIIFVCHFANNIDIIENILLIAYLTLEKYEIFDFNKHTDIFERAKDIMNTLLTQMIVGTENDVEVNRQKELKIKDEMGIQDGSVYEPTEITDEVAEKEQALISLSAAMRVLDVLGQIIKNYPGDIDGKVKISIIDEIHNLGMRITEAMLSAIGLIEEEFISYVMDYVKDKKHIKDEHEFIKVSQNIFSWLITNMTCVMIRKISTSLCNEALLFVVDETFSKSSSISQKLILMDLKYNLLKKPNITETFQLAGEFKKNKTTRLAEYVLRSIIVDYLIHNKCGHEIRAKLCSRFNLSDKKVLVAGAIRCRDE